MNLSFHPEAEAEVTEAVDYYEQVSVGPGFCKRALLGCGTYCGVSERLADS